MFEMLTNSEFGSWAYQVAHVAEPRPARPVHRPLAPGAPQVLVLRGVSAALLANLALRHQGEVAGHPVVDGGGVGRRFSLHRPVLADDPGYLLALDFLCGALQALCLL